MTQSDADRIVQTATLRASGKWLSVDGLSASFSRVRFLNPIVYMSYTGFSAWYSAEYLA
jgi:hypothetical protein